MKYVGRMMIVIGLALGLWVPASYAQNVFVANRTQSSPMYKSFCNFALPDFEHPINGPCLYQPGCYAGTNQAHCPNPNKNEYGLVLEVPAGTYLVTAKTTVQSFDSGAQPGACRLMFFQGLLVTRGPSDAVLKTLRVIDRTDYRIGKKEDGSEYSVSGLAVFTTPQTTGLADFSGGGSFVFACYGYNQYMLDRAIVATKLDDIVNDNEPNNFYSIDDIQGD